MKFDPQKHHRRSIRLKEYDYASPGAYFVTTVIWRRENILGTVRDGEVTLSPYGWIVSRAWRALPNHYPHIHLDAFVIVPNHIHGILIFDDHDVGAGLPLDEDTWGRSHSSNPNSNPKAAETCPYVDGQKPRHGLGEVMRAFKSYAARRINKLQGTAGQPVWQRNYYDRVVRNERELDAIREYIQSNPLYWDDDQENIATPEPQTGRRGRSVMDWIRQNFAQ